MKKKGNKIQKKKSWLEISVMKKKEINKKIKKERIPGFSSSSFSASSSVLDSSSSSESSSSTESTYSGNSPSSFASEESERATSER
ncbi:hypothetical protein M1146_03450 [Patescibacteria group bacterium]|nr:hypothetical protein [Patescibacteria group bacterium]